MTVPAPPYKITAIDGEPEQDPHGNRKAFVQLDCGESALLSMRGPFPIVGDEITDRVLTPQTSKKGNQYFKLVKAGHNGSQAPPNDAAQDRGGDTYEVARNASIVRQHSQEMALRWWDLMSQGSDPAFIDAPEQLVGTIDFFQKDAEQARDKAVERASGTDAARPAGTSAAVSPDGVVEAQAPSEPPSGPSHYGPTDKQMPVLLKMARERGLDGPAMKRYLKAYCGVEAFSDLPKQGCVDKWAEALKRPDPVSDIPVDDSQWPPPVDTAEADEDVPF